VKILDQFYRVGNFKSFDQPVPVGFYVVDSSLVDSNLITHCYFD